MDMAFLNAANRADTFPPQDPWLAGADLNYYYLGQLAMAVLVKLTDVAPDRGYNLAVAALFGADRRGGVHARRRRSGARRAGRAARVRAGLAAVALVLVAGNLEGARLLIADGGPLRDYDWFARVARDRRHDQRVPVVLVPARRPARARARAAVHAARARASRCRSCSTGPRLAPRGRALFEGVACRARGRVPLRGQLVVLSGDGRAARAGRCSPGCATRAASRRGPPRCAGCCSCSRGSALLMLPFHLSFDPAARGIGRRARRGAGSPAGCATTLLLYGSLAGLVAFAYAGRLMATRRPGRNAAWIAGRGAVRRLAARGARVRCTSRCWPSRCWSRWARCSRPASAPAARLVWLLVAGGVACLLGPELLYVRDEFDGGPLYRMNTVFKLGYQAWLLLGLAGDRRAGVAARVAAAAPACAGRSAARGAARRRARSSTRSRARTRARTASRARRRSTASAGCATARPGDVGAIDWLDDARGRRRRSCSSRSATTTRAFGHARISTFTGLPTVLGWPGHELQWGHDVGHAARGRRAHLRVADGGRAPGAAASATASATSSSARSSAPTTATRASRSGTRSASGCSTRTGRSWGAGRRRRHRGERGGSARASRDGTRATSGCTTRLRVLDRTRLRPAPSSS